MVVVKFVRTGTLTRHGSDSNHADSKCDMASCTAEPIAITSTHRIHVAQSSSATYVHLGASPAVQEHGLSRIVAPKDDTGVLVGA